MLNVKTLVDFEDETEVWDPPVEQTLIPPQPPIWAAETELVNPDPNDQPTLDWIDLDMLYLLARAARARRNRNRR